MLISLLDLVKKYKLHIHGILHVGAHECEEKEVYDKVGVKDVVWVEGNLTICDKMRKIYPGEKIYNALISNKDNEMVDFIITNNGQSSSILELEEHKIQHPHIHEVERRKIATITLKTLFDENKLNFDNYNFLNCDTQGAELLVLKSMGDQLKKFDYLYLEVNTKHLYKDCPLLPEILDYVGEFGFKQVELKMTSHFWGDIFMIRNYKF
jgi:FkbM family methyltransferase